MPRAFTEWAPDPWALAFIVVLGVLYLAGVRQLRRSGQSWPTGRIVAFCGLGLGFAVIATMSFVGVYQSVLFYARGGADDPAAACWSRCSLPSGGR